MDIIGTDSNDMLIGTGAAERIEGLGGADLIDGAGGADQLFGGDGDDRFRFATTLPENSEAGLIDGGAGYDILDLRLVAGVRIGAPLEGDGYFNALVGGQEFGVRAVEEVLLGDDMDVVELPSTVSSRLVVRTGAGFDMVTLDGAARVFGEGDRDFFYLSENFGDSGGRGGIDGGDDYDYLHIRRSSTIDLAAMVATIGEATMVVRNVEAFELAALGGITTTALGDSSDNVFYVSDLYDDGLTRVVLDGRGGNDTLTGGGGNDVLTGGDGDDYLFGNGGDDVFIGGNGNDRLVGAAGRDVLDGGEGDDELRGFDGDDILTGGAGDDRLGGGSGADLLTGGDGNDILEGDLSQTTIEGGNDTLDGGAGDDSLEGDGGDDRLSGGDGADQLYGGAGDDVIDGGEGDDFLSGVATDGWLVESDRDTLRGEAGSDQFYVGYGDMVDGGTGIDTAYFMFFDGEAAVTADFRTVTNGGSVTVGNATITGIEYISGYSLTNFNDVVIAGSSEGVDGFGVAMSGNGGNDDLTGTSGVDTLYGGEGNDRCCQSNANSSLRNVAPALGAGA